MGVRINSESTTTGPSPLNGQQPKPQEDLNAFYWYQIFTQDPAVVETQNVNLAWRLPYYCNVPS